MAGEADFELFNPMVQGIDVSALIKKANNSAIVPQQKPPSVSAFVAPGNSAAASAVDPKIYEIIEAVFPQAAVTKSAGFSQKDRDYLLQALQTGFLQEDLLTNCGGGGGGSAPGAVKAIAIGTGLKAGSLLSSGLLGAAGGPIGLAIGLFAGIFGSIFGRHAQAVKLEQGTLCQVVPQANQLLAATDYAVGNNDITAEQGMAQLAQLLKEFHAAVAQIIKRTPTQCNAACWYERELEGLVLLRKNLYFASRTPSGKLLLEQAAKVGLFAVSAKLLAMGAA